MSSPKYVQFHNPMEHPTYEADGVTRKKEKVPGVNVKFRIPTHESGQFEDFDLAPGEECTVSEKNAFAIASLAPQLVRGPAPKTEAKVDAKPDTKKSA
jgi:hypothetical protein